MNEFGFIFVEKLQPKEMLGKFSILNKYINDAAWSQFFNFISYKAEWAGRTFVKVDPKNTTQSCSGCGKIVPKDLSVRVHSCPHCGLIMDRDQNAAKNIYRLGHSLVVKTESVC